MKKLIVFGVLGLLACQARPAHTDVHAMDGAPAYRLDCPTEQFNRKACQAEASRLCGKEEIIFSFDADHNHHSFVECVKPVNL